MKRYDHLYEKIYDLENLRKAHQHAKKGKGWYREVVEIDKDPDKYLKQIQEMLINHTYKTSEYEVFYKKDGKKVRKIYKLPYFPDRICQWAILQVIEPCIFSSFDHWLKEQKHVKHYYRYMDDIVIFGRTKEELLSLLKEIQQYFRTELKLNVKGNWQIFPTYIRGVDFLGYRTFYKYTLLRKSTCQEMKKKMTAIRNKVEAGNMMNYSEWCSIKLVEIR